MCGPADDGILTEDGLVTDDGVIKAGLALSPTGAHKQPHLRMHTDFQVLVMDLRRLKHARVVTLQCASNVAVDRKRGGSYADGTLSSLVKSLGDHLGGVQERVHVAEQLRCVGLLRPEDICPSEEVEPDAQLLAARCGILVGQALVLIVASRAANGALVRFIGSYIGCLDYTPAEQCRLQGKRARKFLVSRCCCRGIC